MKTNYIMKKSMLLLPLVLLVTTQLWSQNEDPVLFFVEDNEVHVSEFQYIYDKNNRDSTKGTRESLADYLQLYIQFKLKVQAAKDAGLDTIQALQDELKMYRKQLAKNYLLDKEIEEAITKKVFERMKEDLHLSHILIKVRKGEDTTAVIDYANMIRDSIASGQRTFEEMALKYSADGTVQKNKGDLGYLTAMFPNGFERLEEVAYQMKEGSLSAPVRSQAGYHILYLHDRRPARGTVEISQILVRKPETGSREMAKKKIEAAYEALQNGLPWEEAVLEFTEDKKNRRKGGYLGVFEIGVYEESLEDAAYALEEQGDISEVVESSIGYHILKRGIATRPQEESFDQMKSLIMAQLEKTNRLDKAQQTLVEKIKQKAPFQLEREVYERFKATINDDFTNYKWESPNVEEKVLLSFGNTFERSNQDFIDYLKRNTRERLRLDRKMQGQAAADLLLQRYIEDMALEYEQTRLEEKYSDFRNLMREYREGILLFEITKDEIWDKAPQDTAGLINFYEQNKENYRWKERAKILTFRVNTTDNQLMNRVKKMVMQEPVQKVIEAFNGDSTLVTYTSKVMEKGDPEFGARSWQQGVLSNLTQKANGYTFEYISELIPPRVKSLEEARGFVISDYQTYLEQKWVRNLGEKYRVKVVDHEFDKLIEAYQK